MNPLRCTVQRKGFKVFSLVSFRHNSSHNLTKNCHISSITLGIWSSSHQSQGTSSFFCQNVDMYISCKHTDAFFRSQRDINRHGSWLNFLEIQVNLANFIYCTFETAWDKYSKIGPTFGCLSEKKDWNFYLEIIFFKLKQDFIIFI